MQAQFLSAARDLLVCALAGLLTAYLFDFLDMLLSVFGLRKCKIIDHALDALRVLSFTLVFILILYFLRDGKIRWMLLFSLLMGAYVYYRGMRRISRAVTGVLLTPIRTAAELILRCIKKIIAFLKVSIAKIRAR